MYCCCCYYHYWTYYLNISISIFKITLIHFIIEFVFLFLASLKKNSCSLIHYMFNWWMSIHLAQSYLLKAFFIWYLTFIIIVTQNLILNYYYCLKKCWSLKISKHYLLNYYHINNFNYRFSNFIINLNYCYFIILVIVSVAVIVNIN